ncbi:MAG: ABC transporter ATP-binding protein [Clostridiales bacterium]|jgi:ABC-2 type transport system ATP-binding protein|nr:ABC transporter ATP-binding protein [Clostridiales bacterium]
MIDFQNVTKRYGSSSAAAIDNLSMKVSDNGIYCLLGRNGAGKTTLFKLIAGHTYATEGSVFADGKKVSTLSQPDCVNFVDTGSEQFNMRLSELLDTAVTLQDGFDLGFARQMAGRFGLDLRKKYKQLSFGMKTMLTTILTLANKSKVILLDEPILGFDAIMRDRFNTLIQESYELHPRIIVVSTHLIDEIAKITQRLIIIDNGKVMLHTGIEDIDERAYVLTGLSKAVIPLLDNLNCIGKNVVGDMLAAYIYDERIEPPKGVAMDKLSLQDFFVKLIGGDIHYA